MSCRAALEAATRHEAEVAARFDQLSARFKAHVSRDDVRFLAVRAGLGPLPGARVLDLGCGKGRFADRFSEAGATVIGLDRSAAMLSGARGERFERVHGSASRLPFRGGSFDAAFAIEVFEHLPSIEPVLAELRRVVRPGGRIVIVDKNAGSCDPNRPWLPGLLIKWIDQKRGRWMYPPGGPVRETWFWPRSFRRRLCRFFEGVDVTYLLVPEEARWALFRYVPRARRLLAWSGQVPVTTRNIPGPEVGYVRSLDERTLPPLPLLLWETPPGLELILRQEGVAYLPIREPHPLAFRGGRFVLYDSKKLAAVTVHRTLSPEHIAIDIDGLRQDERTDPFQALIDNQSAPATWQVGTRRLDLTEQVARTSKSAIRRRLLARLRQSIDTAGGIWARLGSYPFPYRSAFNFRADLDETAVDDYFRFAEARRPLADCCTHFVSTRAYGDEPDVLRDLSGFDSQSHGHYHVIYRDPELNRRNLTRAHEILSAAGIAPVGFAAPHGRWNRGLDLALENLGYLYASDFQVGYDDLPFFPWRDDRFSKVLQVPIHPVCEGLFLEAGCRDGAVIADYLADVVRSRIDAGEPAFVYGHPERRLARYPEVLAALDRATRDDSLLWKVSLTEFARWWAWRDSLRWSLVPRADRRFEVQLEEWSPDYPLGLEIVRGRHVGSLPIRGSRTPLRLEDLAYERRDPSTARSVISPTPAPRPPSLRAAVRRALDWETITPLDELPVNTLTARVKKGLRRWRQEASR